LVYSLIHKQCLLNIIEAFPVPLKCVHCQDADDIADCLDVISCGPSEVCEFNWLVIYVLNVSNTIIFDLTIH